VAFGIGLFPLEKTWDFISQKSAQAVGAAKPERELGGELAAIQGLEDRGTLLRSGDAKGASGGGWSITNVLAIIAPPSWTDSWRDCDFPKARYR
jgi:hypothetical protein